MGISFVKTGKDSQALAEKNKAEMERREAERGKMFRFFLKKGEECRITFVDGELSNEGLLLPPRFYEHTIQLAGKWETFVCPEQTDPSSGAKCPICREKSNLPYLASAFTVIDHRSFTTAQNKTYSDTRKLFIAKPGTMELLAKIAVKRGGLAGATFDVMRIGDKDPGVGGQFDFVKKTPLSELSEQFVEQIEVKGVKTTQSKFRATNYDEEIPYFSADQLSQMLGLAVGAGAGASHSTPASTSMAEHL